MDGKKQQEQAMLQIRTLGEFALFERHEGAWRRIVQKNLFNRGPSLTLLKVLICQGMQLATPPFAWKHHKASRDVLIDAIWLEEEVEMINAVRSLQTAKCVVNSALRSYIQGTDAIVLAGASDGLAYELDEELIEVDADCFEQQVALASRVPGQGEEAQAAWEAALALYQGDFLPDDRYNEWSRQRREQLRAKYRLGLHRLSQIAVANGQITEAVLFLHPYVLAHPQDEDALSLLLPLLAQQQRYTEALTLAKSARRALEEEGSTLSKATLVLLERIQLAHESLCTTTPLSSFMVAGSEQSLAVLPTHGTTASSLVFLPGQMQSIRWFDLKQAAMQVLVEQWMGRAKEYGTLQAILSQEIAMFEQMKTQYAPETYKLSRRQAIRALVALPTALVTALQQGQISNVLIESFLPHCAAGITACWYLINEGEFATVQRTIASYLPTLEAIVQQSDLYRTSAANLAAQTFLLAGLLALHREGLNAFQLHCRKAVEYAQESGDQTLLVRAWNGLAYTLYALKQSREALSLFQRAENESTHLLPLLRSDVLTKLAGAYGQTNHRQEALRCIGEARTLFPENPSYETPIYLSGDFGAFSLILWEGKTRLELGQYDPYGGHFQRAESIFAEAENLADVPERFRLEILNYRAETALYLGELEAFCGYMEQGIQGAQALGSQKRRQEVIELYKTVRKPTHKWRNEGRVRDLGDLLIE